MVALNFSPIFAGPVERREKKQTIRQTRRAKVGDRIQLYIGQRTKTCRKLSEVDPVCICVDYVAIRPNSLTVGDVTKHPRDMDEFARLDGFADYAAMHKWFSDRYGTEHFVGYLHRWEWQ
ncbi:hypothetical protein CN223_27900 [Sinorhizobium meliloti]|uniref:hypothetical protein n=1 Tax=Rhizobium meliloti TaxID=382 RepID=UPI000FD84136|nr:hypothetical protein [Sinorhizobium meliloti]RVG72467.1 hypothetical protein CN223_27900 [Sinorhizobium meliloti]